MFGGPKIEHIAGHLGFSADGTRLNLDVRTVTDFHIATMDVETGDVDVWHSAERCYKHTQFSPTDPDLLLFCQDWWDDDITGEYTDYENRIWLQRAGEDPWPLFDEMDGKHSHEWWAADGKGIWYVDYESGTHYYDLATTPSVWADRSETSSR